MKAKEYLVLEMAVERGVEWGWRRAHKHADHPSNDILRSQITEFVLTEICEWFDFEVEEI